MHIHVHVQNYKKWYSPLVGEYAQFLELHLVLYMFG